ncbi:hypothetical protein PFFCH_03625 [Plasmodium falciparum FCH/4]|uniref:Uncharacterized protein n=1 Tax=Plasmodium falciparum FCH/4 TaxID=1036724 RepID=A0A024VJM5_PLAFA|nr:hypothetical protein PFFCH_03625 [Plasmodium falciparum FCH/4]
MYKKLNNVRDY